MAAKDKTHYADSVIDFRKFVERLVPRGATIVVISKGDRQLLALSEREAWHFPQRADGVYAGYYPADSAAAIAHLEGLREKGAQFLAIPAASLWWLEEYGGFGGHLEARYSEVARDDDVGAIYALAPKPAGESAEREDRGQSNGAIPSQGELTDDLITDLNKLFDPAHYAAQVGVDFASDAEAREHYLTAGPSATANPHPLFDNQWYVRRNPQLRSSGEAPLAHFVRRAAVDGLDPSPFFDTGHYYDQKPHLRDEGVNALVHYVESALDKAAAHPNPLFHDSYYLAMYGNVEGSAGTPLEHFLLHAGGDVRYGSPLHKNMLEPARRPASSLARGMWRRGLVLFFSSGHPLGKTQGLGEVAEQIGIVHHTGSLVVTVCTGGRQPSPASACPTIVLEDFELAAEIFRPSSLRFLARSLLPLNPLFAVADIPEVLEPLASTGLGTVYALPDSRRQPSRKTLERAISTADRVVAPSPAAVRTTAKKLGVRPAKLTELERCRAPDLAQALVDRAVLDLGVELPAHGRKRSARRPKKTKPKVLVPCSDWALSGVNAALEAVGQELIKLGWDLEIVFTRKPEMVLPTVQGDHHMPALPYRFLDRDKGGVTGMWEAFIAELEMNAPSILLMAYDFYANGVAAAVTDKVGVVTWAQANDGDYYEQVYRLGRYCNAVVCVSGRIKEGVTALNPVIGERAHVIHNSSVSEADIAPRRGRRTNVLRLAYTGRLVQYQKRVLDYIGLAQALDRTGVPYEISLIGTFSPRDTPEEEFRRLAEPQLADGRIKLLGRLTRAQILEELTRQDFFVLLSDFEGLPLSLVEAMARGAVPIVAESESGIPELIDTGDNGMIVRGRNYDRWAHLLVDLWQDRDRHLRMSRQARDKVREQYTVEHVGAQFSDLFERIIEEISDGSYRRPPSLNWGLKRSHTGDILPPPSMHDPGGFTWV